MPVPATVSAHEALIQLQAYVEHWQADVAGNLKPTPESLETALVWIERGLASLRQKEPQS